MALIPLRLFFTVTTSLLLLLVLDTAFAGHGQVTEVELVGLQATTSQPTEEQQQVVPTVVPTHVQSSLSGTKEPGTTLSLAEALEFALANQPGLASLDLEYWALDSLAWQAGQKPNPSMELEFEEFGGTSDAKGIRALGTSLTYTQPIERGGKRTKREVAAALEREVILWDIAGLEHEIQAEVRVAFSVARAAQYEVEQQQKYRRLVQRIYDTVATSVEAGRSARLELERVGIELARLDLQVAIAQRSKAQAYLELAATWGKTSVEFTEVEMAETGGQDVPALGELQEYLEGHPALLRYAAEYEALCALVDLENSNGVGDLELFGGLTRLNENEETVFKVGVAWDLTTQHKNEGNISAAGYRLEAVGENLAATRLELETELAALHQLAQSALLNYQAYGEKLMPSANQALALTEEGFRYGKFELMDVLDAQRTVLELESEQASALMELQLVLAGIEALLNIDLNRQTGLEEQTELTETPGATETVARTNEEHNHE